MDKFFGTYRFAGGAASKNHQRNRFAHFFRVISKQGGFQDCYRRSQTFQTLLNLGVREIATLQQMPMEMLESVLGKNGRII